MILFTVGTENFPFNRLSNWIDVLLENNVINSPDTFFQYGSCEYSSKLENKIDYLTSSKFDELVNSSSLIISHCGEGSLLNFSQFDIPFILVPRSASSIEHIDNHQIDLGIALSSIGVPIAWSIGDLVKFITNPSRVKIKSMLDNNSDDICNYIHSHYNS
ncbi:glycosyltransferase [Synechococcus sp. N32]|uniref:glycosyltransferase n=1 Tax=Synechococcus sp. N32 TaxID=2575514 RepID=UPI000E0F4A5A|nr:glycosyltransferase [Synechococcus sp. N32]